MNLYENIFAMLALPNTVSRCAMGTLELPLIDVSAPADWYGFPPALIPLWSTGSRPTYTGVWKHWFTDRETSYVKMYVGSGRLTVEIARTAEQLMSLIAMTSISERDGIEADLIAFATEVGIPNLTQIDAVSLESGDEAQGLIAIDQFRENTPLESVGAIADYTGSFPSGYFHAYPWWENACSFELSDETNAAWPDDLPRPPWLVDSVDKAALFRAYLGNGNLKNAWLTLNSTGWTIADARAAITDLGAHAQDSQFTLLVEAWLSVADDSAGSY